MICEPVNSRQGECWIVKRETSDLCYTQNVDIQFIIYNHFYEWERSDQFAWKTGFTITCGKILGSIFSTYHTFTNYFLFHLSQSPCIYINGQICFKNHPEEDPVLVLKVRWSLSICKFCFLLKSFKQTN